MAHDGSQAEEYQPRAAQCVQLAQAATDPNSKLKLLEMARGWLTLAEQAIKNSQTTLVFETPDRSYAPQLPPVSFQLWHKAQIGNRWRRRGGNCLPGVPHNIDSNLVFVGNT